MMFSHTFRSSSMTCQDALTQTYFKYAIPITVFIIFSCTDKVQVFATHPFKMFNLGSSIDTQSPSCTTLGSTQPLKELSTRNLPGDTRKQVHKTDHPALCEPTV
jgi:hypothetical protein